jgi:hypothetical protein
MIVMREVAHPSRPYCLGTQRRRAPKGARTVGAGGRALAGRRAHSLDTDKYLATTVAKWLKDQENEYDRYESALALWRRLCSTVYGIWQEFVIEVKSTPNDGATWRWWNAYEAEKEAIWLDVNPGYDEWLEKRSKKYDVTQTPEAYLQILYLESWKRKNRPTGLCARALNWEKQYFQLFRCQGEWIAMQASCCREKTEPVAVPIGCNHRLCPLCNWHRSQNAHRKVKKLYDRINHPVFLTLTVPNVKRISKRTFHLIRDRVNQFIAEHKYMLDEPGGMKGGGVYSLETTWNKTEKSWHVHAHILMSANFKLPAKHDDPSEDQRINFAGQNLFAFTYVKLALEYDWSRLWCRDFRKRWSYAPRANAKESSLIDERFMFEQWVKGCDENKLREYDYRTGKREPITWLSASEMRARTEWNIANRRVMWIRQVNDRDKAVKEVLKYITKCSEFVDQPECIIAFHDATRGLRLIQTFGSWYGIDFAVEFDTKHPEDWSKLECRCGMNHWERLGVVKHKDVRMQADGRWRLLRPFDDDTRWTFGRPKIRALEGREERNGAQPWNR